MKKILIILFVTIPVIILPNLFGTISALVKENGTLLLSAPKGTVIDEILFASYGTPVGYPNKYVKDDLDSKKYPNNFILGNCHAVNSKQIVSQLAIGKRTVEIKATNSVFGDPCRGIIKRLFVTASFTSIAEFGLSKANGIWKSYFQGELIEDGSYKMGKKEGLWNYYAPIYLSYYDFNENNENPKKFIINYSRRDFRALVEECNFKEGKKSGVCMYYKFEKLISKGNYKENKRTGPWEFFEESKLTEKGNYKKGNKSGVWKYYASNEIYFQYNPRKKKIKNVLKIEDGENYRIINFKDNYPTYNDDFKKKNDDLTIINENWGSIEIEFNNKVKLIMVDFYDQGCGKPYTTFNFKNINKKKTLSHKNISFETHNIIFNESELLNDMTFFEIRHCEGSTFRITIIYK